ncbi:MAG TPA: hypothetical protein DDX68_10720 [Clostridium sp.]|nr:hypothetical protein [Clostridium sp.]
MRGRQRIRAYRISTTPGSAKKQGNKEPDGLKGKQAVSPVTRKIQKKGAYRNGIKKLYGAA